MQKIKCENCGSRDFTQVDGYYVCDYCGTKYKDDEEKDTTTEQNETAKKVENFFEQLSSEANKASQEIEKNVSNKEHEIIQLILCFFLGGLGAHKFYNKKIGAGILYLFTYGLFGIGWFVDTVKCIIALVNKK